MLVTERKSKLKKHKRFPLAEIVTNSCHVNVKKEKGLIYIQKVIWCRFESENEFTALPPSWLHKTLRRSREIQKWLNTCKALEFAPEEITKDPEVIAALVKAGYYQMVPDGHVAPEGKEWRLQQNNMEPQYSNQIYSLEQDTFLFGGDTDTSALCIIILYTGASYLLPLQYIGGKLRVSQIDCILGIDD